MLHPVDRQTIERASKGDREAYERLARSVADRLYPIAARILHDRDLADDAVQKTLVAIWRELPKLRDADSFDGWTYRILVRFCTNELKARRRFRGDVHEVKVAGKSAEGTTMVAVRDQLSRGFLRLSPDHRAIVVLTYYEGLTGAEVARALGIPPGTVASRLHYALRTMRAALEADSRAGPSWSGLR